jgi:hypothetical protein
MSRTKEDLIDMFAKKNAKKFMAQSDWPDLIRAMQSLSQSDRVGLLNALRGGQSKRAGIIMQKALHSDASERSKADVTTKLANDSLSLNELGSLL